MIARRIWIPGNLFGDSTGNLYTGTLAFMAENLRYFLLSSNDRFRVHCVSPNYISHVCISRYLTAAKKYTPSEALNDNTPALEKCSINTRTLSSVTPP